MLSDFEMITHQHYGGHDITIIPIYDVHLGSPQCMEQEFIRFINQVKETPNVYLILGGDLIENGVRSSVGDSVFRQTMSPSVQKREMANILEPVRDRILCMLPGNHEARSRKDADDCPCYDIACKLDLETVYRENIAFLKIQMGGENRDITNGQSRPTYVITAVHGAGSGMLTGSLVNRAERFGGIIDGMDLLLVGHGHKPFATQPGKIVIDPRNNKVTVKPFRVVCATSWLGYGGYAARGMMNPSAFLMQSIVLCGDHKEIIETTRSNLNFP